MKARTLSLFPAFLACVAVATLTPSTPAHGATPPADGPAEESETQEEESEDLEILTRGPVHEAFAESVSFEPQPGLIVTSKPPEPIEELPPEHQPEGDNVAWIPGYWAWDDDESDFLWVSGIWRNLPPGRQWVPGYWSDIGDGKYQWTSGYWADAETEEIAYVPTAPPENIDTGPTAAAPSDDHSWVPGNWIWNESRYAWRPGYWLPLRPDWTWVPSRYCWTPRGYVYVDGYWDYAIASRGVLFAPVHYRRHIYTTPGYHYTPSVVIGLNVFSDHLFVRPRACHYYFGDYYAPRYRRAGFFPSFRWHRSHRGYDPIFAHHRWHHRHDKSWLRQRVERFHYLRKHSADRPPRHWAAMRNLGRDRFDRDGRGGSRIFARSLANFARNPGTGRKFRRLDQDRRSALLTQRQSVRDFSLKRRQLESRRDAVAKASRKATARAKFQRSPLIGKQANRFSRNAAPPKRPESRAVRGNYAKRLSAARERTQQQRRLQRGRAGQQRRQATPQRQIQRQRQQLRRQQQGRQATPQRRIQPQRQQLRRQQQRRQATPQRRIQQQRQQLRRQQQRRQATPQRRIQPQRQQLRRQQQRRQAAPQRRIQRQRQQTRRAAQPRQQARSRQASPRQQARSSNLRQRARAAQQRRAQRGRR